ncbi:hypothetical protein PsYK624_012150 [Phanerochaete sordida]|uniref:Uncharacterized protein n=1 Tax=Phanerochaete sordida TaxID=48140 RepID=A0A9P3L8X7_9APHY|nr:hypothetical protein PsYK624_012150 [Phanerochaete sordida]
MVVANTSPTPLFVPFLERKLRRPLSCSSTSSTPSWSSASERDERDERVSAQATAKSAQRQGRRVLPEEVLRDIIAYSLVDTIHQMVHTLEHPHKTRTSTRPGPAWHWPWARTVPALRLASRQLHQLVDASLALLLGLACLPSGRLAACPLRAVRAIAPPAEVAARRALQHAWARARDVKGVLPLLHRGPPLARLYRLAAYGPWLFYAYARCFAGAHGGAVAGVHAGVLQELEEAVAAYARVGVAAAGLVRRIDSLHVQLHVGVRVMQCAKEALELRRTLDEEGTSRLYSEAKKTALAHGATLARCARHTRPADDAAFCMLSFGLQALLRLLVCLNDAKLDRAVRALLETGQRAELVHLWRTHVEARTSHAQRRRLLK